MTSGIMSGIPELILSFRITSSFMPKNLGEGGFKTLAKDIP